MGFRTGAYAKVWEVIPKSDVSTRIRISVSRKNKQTGEYEQDFSGYASCVGTAAAQKALKLNEGSRIKIGDCDVTTKYDAQKKITYTNYILFSFDIDGEGEPPAQDNTAPQSSVDDGDIDDSRLPF